MVRNSWHGRDNWEKGVDFIGQNSGRKKRQTNIEQ